MSTAAYEQQHHPSQQHSNFVQMQQPETAKNVHVYLNGDRFYKGRKFVVNRRHISDFDGFLNQVTMGIKAPFGAVRNIYTPTAGHRVFDLQQLQNGMDVVAGGVERFRRLEYKEIGQKRRPPPRRNIFDIKHHNRMNVSARWRKYVKDPCLIFVYANGDINAPALKLLLIPRMMKSWDLVLGEITEKISLRTGQAVRKLYNMEYGLLRDPSELENGHYYVAVGTERLKKCPYGEIVAQNSPRRNHALPPLRRSYRPKPPTKENGEQTYTKMYANRRQAKEEEETTVMGASAVTGYRPLRTKRYKPQRPSGGGPPTHEGETVFHAKPVKVKRSGGGKADHEPHPPTEESDSVFRANSRPVKAEEVDEDEDTKVDLPIDQMPADVVDDDETPLTQRDEDGKREKDDEDVSVSLTGRNAEEQIEEIRSYKQEVDDLEDKTDDAVAPQPTAASERAETPTPLDENEDAASNREESANPVEEIQEKDVASRQSSRRASTSDEDDEHLQEDDNVPEEIKDKSDVESSYDVVTASPRRSASEPAKSAHSDVLTPVSDAEPKQDNTLPGEGEAEDNRQRSPSVASRSVDAEAEEEASDDKQEDEVAPSAHDNESTPTPLEEKPEQVGEEKENTENNSPEDGNVETPKSPAAEPDATSQHSTDDENVKQALDVEEDGDAQSDEATREPNDLNLLTPSSPLPEANQDVDDPEKEETAEGDRSRSAADGEDVVETPRPEKPAGAEDGETPVNVENDNDENGPESERSIAGEEARFVTTRPDSNALTVDGDNKATTPNSIPNGTAPGVQEVQP